MDKVFFVDTAQKGVTREFCFAPGPAGSALRIIVEHVPTRDGRYFAEYEFTEFLIISSGSPATAFLAAISEAILPRALRDGPVIPGNRKPKDAPRKLRSSLMIRRERVATTNDGTGVGKNWASIGERRGS
jgi:hypothetical protein